MPAMTRTSERVAQAVVGGWEGTPSHQGVVGGKGWCGLGEGIFEVGQETGGCWKAEGQAGRSDEREQGVGVAGAGSVGLGIQPACYYRENTASASMLPLRWEAGKRSGYSKPLPSSPMACDIGGLLPSIPEAYCSASLSQH